MGNKLLQTIKYLREYGIFENDPKARIVLAAPAHGDKNRLRVYMNGGDIGKIVLEGRKKTIGIDSEEYGNEYKGIIPDSVKVLGEKSGADEDARLDAIVKDEYLKYAQAATTTYAYKSNEKSDKERSVESMIMDFRHQKSGNAAIDMELQYATDDHMGWTKTKQEGHVYISEMKYKGSTWYNEWFFENSKDTKSPRIDLMILNDEGIGLVELKVDNENCGNLRSHINHMKYILAHADVFVKDAERRINVLEKYELLEKEILPNLNKWREHKKIWCGILFVGNEEHLSGAKQKLKEFQDSMGGDIRCSFIGTDIVKSGKLNLASTSFVTVTEFQSKEYNGIF